MILHDVAVVDVASGQIIPHRDVVIANGRIRRIRAAATRAREQGYVIPGLWDMEAHVGSAGSGRGDRALENYVANGVTAVRDMGGDLKRVRNIQARIAKSEMVGPRIFASGAVISDVAAGDSNGSVKVIRTPDEARRAFDAYYDQRVDFIDIRDMDARSFEALAERSRHDGIPFAGFVPDSVPVSVAAEDRMVSMEHLSGLELACSSRQDELRAKMIAANASHDEAAAHELKREAEDSYDSSAAEQLFDLLRRYGVRQTPSLSWWARNFDGAERNFAARVTKEMAQAGVEILAGSDGGEPGIELHHELELLAGAGLTPAQVLRAATIRPARLMRRDDLGQVKPGYAADLVILRGNPLADIHNTRTIDAVILHGRRFYRAQLDRMVSSHGN